MLLEKLERSMYYLLRVVVLAVVIIMAQVEVRVVLSTKQDFH